MRELPVHQRGIKINAFFIAIITNVHYSRAGFIRVIFHIIFSTRLYF